MKILGADFTVELMTDRDSNDLGDCYNRYQRLRLQRDQHPDSMMETLIHEILEAINTKLELNLEHQVISALGASLFAVLKDNGVKLSPLLEDE
jgi:hypothetical protein